MALLPLKEYSVGRYVSLEEFTASQKIMPTGYVDHFQVLFCELNPSLCTAEQRRLPPENAPTPPGFAVRLSPGARILLPDLPVASRYSRRNIRLPLDPKVYKPEFFGRFYNRPLGLIARELAPKSLDDEKLNELLSLYNPNYEGQDILSKTEGSFGVPVRAGSVSVVVPRTDLLNPNSGISILAAKKNVSGFTAANPLHPQSMIAGAPGPPAPFLVEDGCQPPDVPSAVLLQINYCRPGPGELRRRPAIGIIDNLFNPNHPAFMDPALPGRSALNVYRPPNSPEESEPVEVERPNPNFFVKDLDHGTHVAGIIGARPQPSGGVGLLPQALLYGLTVENLTQMQEDEEWSKIRIFNVSLGERPTAEGGQPGAFSGTDVLKEFFVQYSHTLFIVSAGNENRPVRKDTLAWLGYLDNVIVVGATNVPAAPSDTAAALPIRLLRMPDGSGSNFDQTRMVLVAPGERIRSTLFNGQYGEASGTSQATAFVSAAAAALKAAQPSWDAWQIKFRLIATADLWTATDQSNTVFAGELNFKRALLNMENAVFKHENGTTCVGEVETTSLGRQLVIRKGATTTSIPFDKILRVKRNREDSTDYTVIYYEEKPADEFPDRKNRYLRREVSVPAAQMRENYKFNFLPTVPSATCKADGVNLKEMVDFINSINPTSD